MPPSPTPQKRGPKPPPGKPCNCVVIRHPEAGQIERDLRRLGTARAAEGETFSSIARRYDLPIKAISIHRRKHLGLPEIWHRIGRPSKAQIEIQAAERGVPSLPPVPVKLEHDSPPTSPEAKHALLVRTVATLVQLGSYRGLSTVRALAARHGVEESEVVRAHKRAVLSIKDARGGIREQVELSVGVLTSIRDQERKVAEDYTGIAERIVQPSLPRQDGTPPTRTAYPDEIERARSARAIAAQAVDNAISAQKQIDQNTIHRRTAPVVQVSFSASADFGRAQDALVELLDAIVGDRIPGVREKVERGLAVFEDGGERFDSSEWVEYLAELRRDSEAVVVDAAE